MFSNVLVFALVITYVCTVEAYKSCTLPRTNGRGQIVDIEECPQLAEIMRHSSRTQEEQDLVKSAQAGLGGTKVCCPLPCVAPGQKTGRCVDILTCSHFVNMLNVSQDQRTIAYVQSFRCEGLHERSVCCDYSTNPVETNTSLSQPTPGWCPLGLSPPDPSTECCGVDVSSGPSIFVGNKTAIDAYPWLALIGYRVKDSMGYKLSNDLKFLCVGSLISGRFVLTAAHCVAGKILNDGTPYAVNFGVYDKSTEGPDCVPAAGGGEDCTDGDKTVLIAKTIPHPSYLLENKMPRSDIALIKLADVAPFTDFIRPICLPTRDVTRDAPAGMKFWVAGWGTTEAQHSSNVKVHVRVKLVTNCHETYNRIKDEHICAEGEKGNDSYKGDSGAPLDYINGTVRVIIGVVSVGPYYRGAEYQPGIYTNVFHFNSWIRENMN